MSLNNVGDIQTEFLVRNNRTTTDTFITDAMLDDWLRDSHVWAAGSKKWPATEGRVSTTYTSSQEEWNFEGYKSDSFRIIQVGGKRLDKKNFADYQIYREEEPSGTDRIYSDFGRLVFINPYIDASGTLIAYGQYMPTIDPTDKTATTIFSGYEEEGNEAIVEKMSGYLKRREHLPQEAELHDQRAAAKLEEVWNKIRAEQYAYQTHRDRGGMFSRFDVLQGGFREEMTNINRFD